MHSPYLIPALLLTPLVGGLALALLPRGRDGQVRAWALAYSLITLAISIALAVVFFGKDGDARLRHSFEWVAAFGLSFGLGLDGVSLWLVLLTTFLTPLTVLGSFSAVQERVKEFYLWLLVLEAAMLGVFVATDIIFFYVCFEFTLVPLYFLIGIYGSSQRLKAARVFFLYTFTGSMLTFAGVLYVAYVHAAAHGGAWTFDIAALTTTARSLTLTQQTWLLLALLAGFAVKVPLFPLHTWLPLAHTEAPTAGSVLLAGVLLKLGTYGLLKLAIPMTFVAAGGQPGAAVVYAPTVALFAIVGILYTALVCWVQKDLKKLIAYSSVSHLGFCVLGMFALNATGLSGAVIYMVNHGLSTGALFLCVGMIYERFHTREMAAMSGLARAMPVWSFFMVFFCLASAGLPGLNGFVGEFLCLLGAFDWRDGALGPRYAAVAGVGMIFGAIYIFHMLGKVVFGPLKVPGQDGHGAAAAAGRAGAAGHDSRTLPRDLNLREIVTLTPLAVACLYLGLFPAGFLRSLGDAVELNADPSRAPRKVLTVTTPQPSATEGIWGAGAESAKPRRTTSAVPGASRTQPQPPKLRTTLPTSREGPPAADQQTHRLSITHDGGLSP